jgi:phage FluMu protein Com
VELKCRKCGKFLPNEKAPPNLTRWKHGPLCPRCQRLRAIEKRGKRERKSITVVKPVAKGLLIP